MIDLHVSSLQPSKIKLFLSDFIRGGGGYILHVHIKMERPVTELKSVAQARLGRLDLAQDVDDDRY